MPIVIVKNKYQVVIPQRVREQIGVSVGDVFEARAEKGRIVFEPKSVVDRGIAESLADFENGRSFGPFDTHAEFVASLHKEARKLASRKKRARR
ncbi:MAG: AbrB/MazE/SpoVT family DNA-binding domain-containing protein [Bryobacteraceae bacterium]|jgi:bifunctional DNA-binding transcriptional regulator/antitoxin component of YhaV-PrlF toxin-antitoxin module